MKLSRNRWLEATALVLIALWLGVPALRIWKADRLVDELCSRNGGFNVYEPVLLSEGEPGQVEQAEAPIAGASQVADKYYRARKTRTVRGKPDAADGTNLVVIQDLYQVYRSSDKKLLGEAIAYTRQGGDPIAPWRFTPHSCPTQAEEGLEKRIFRKARLTPEK